MPGDRSRLVHWRRWLVFVVIDVYQGPFRPTSCEPVLTRDTASCGVPASPGRFHGMLGQQLACDAKLGLAVSTSFPQGL